MFYKSEIIKLLDEAKIEYEYYDHPAVFNMEEDAMLDIPHLEYTAKNVFVCNSKKRDFILISVKGSQRIVLKTFEKEYGYKHLKLTSADLLFEKLGLAPGSVSPFGLLNNDSCDVIYYIDKHFDGDYIFVHPNDNTASVFMKTDDLLWLIRRHGIKIEFFDPETLLSKNEL